ncbi:MAG: alpha/beta hydrolase family protein [Candidatus Aminicenantaceae bacterium]
MKEKLSFKNSKGEKLCGILSNPTSKKEAPIITLCHGFSTSKDGRTYVRLEQSLNKNNISTFRFDFFGHGESDGKFEEITISEAVNDVQNALYFLKKSGYTKIGLFGSSFGGMASIITASNTDNLYVLALKSPVSDFSSLLINQNNAQEIKNWKENGFIYITSSDGDKRRLNYSFFLDAKNIKGYESARKIKIPCLIVHGDRDETVPIEQSKKIARLMKNCKLEIIKGGDHTYSKPENFEKMLDLILKFIIRNS